MPDEIVFMGEEWAAEFAGMTDSELEAACRKHMREVCFFPSIAHILEAHRSNKSKEPAKTFSLPYQELSVDERIEIAKRHLPEIMADLGRITRGNCSED